MVTDINTQRATANWNATPSIKTDRVSVDSKFLIKATVIVGTMTLTDFSDEIQDTAGNSIQDYARQATQRALQMVPAR